MEPAVPSLSTDGWVTDIRKKADLLLAHYFASDYSQSNVFLSRITSLSYQVQTFGHDPTQLRTLIQNGLETYLSRYFDSVEVNVTIEKGARGDTARYDIRFDGVVVQDGLRYSIGRLIEIQNNKVKRVMTFFETGK